VTVFTTILQTLAKKLFHRKLFRIAPIHHHFEAIGWPREKVVMRYWIVAAVAALLGVVVALAHIAS
jgi:phospho-N-acetylmuramoyl-pentapeptide-transferase